MLVKIEADVQDRITFFKNFHCIRQLQTGDDSSLYDFTACISLSVFAVFNVKN